MIAARLLGSWACKFLHKLYAHIFNPRTSMQAHSNENIRSRCDA